MNNLDLINKYKFDADTAIETLYSLPGAFSHPNEYDSVALYAHLKSFTSMDLFYVEKHIYQVKSILENGLPGEDDVEKIGDELNVLNKVIENPILKDPNTFLALLNDAKLKYRNGTIYQEEDKEKLELMIYSLFRDDFFNQYPLPEGALHTINDVDPVSIFGQVYSRYFLLYDYLVEKLPKTRSTKVSRGKSKNSQETNSSYEVKMETFKDIFQPQHRPKYETIIKLLSDELPERVTSKFDNLTEPFVFISDGGVSWNPSVDNAISYITGIYFVCLKLKWLKSQVTKEKAKEALGETFKVVIKSRTAFNKKKNDSFQEKYIAPFETLFYNIK